MKANIRTALSLPSRDWLTLTRAWFLLLLVDLGLRVLPFRRVQRACMQKNVRQAPRPDAVESTISTTDRLVNMAARHHLYSMSCLRRALVLLCLLRREGIAAELQIGVRKEHGGLAAHAWAEHAGRPIGQPWNVALYYFPLLARDTNSFPNWE